MQVPPNHKKIPTPWRIRWQSFRMQAAPVIVFLVALTLAVVIWRDHIGAPTLIGQVQPRHAQIVSPVDGRIARLEVRPFDEVLAGGVLGEIHPVDPERIRLEMDVIAAEIEHLRVAGEPLVGHQRVALNFESLRVEELRKRVDLAKVNAQKEYARAELARMQSLFDEGLVPQREVERARTELEVLEREGAETAGLIAEVSAKLARMAPGIVDDGEATDACPILSAIAVQEAKLKVAEAALRPVALVAPISGVVSEVFRSSGEYVRNGDAVLAISDRESTQIVAYVRAPMTFVPEAGAQVNVRTRGGDRASALAHILAVGAQLEPITPALLMAGGISDERTIGLPVLISAPAGLQLFPGDIVDVIYDGAGRIGL